MEIVAPNGCRLRLYKDNKITVRKQVLRRPFSDWSEEVEEVDYTERQCEAIREFMKNNCEEK